MKPNHLRLILQFAAMALLAGAFTGCNSVSVKAYERGMLAEYGMRPDRDPLAVALNEHTFFSREATGGGRSVGGGGCGCN